jgi:SAM-dependent methyltransferase
MASAIQTWKQRIEAHNSQTLRARGDQQGYDDLWSTLAEGFRADPRRTDDPVVNLLAGWVGADSTVLDVGGGAGAHALPLALRCRQVTVVEPSPSMVSALTDAYRAAGIENVSVATETWEEANVEPADLVLCANVVYGVADIEPFVRKLDAHAQDRIAVVVWMDAPLSIMSPLWREVHGEERTELPALPELLTVLWEMEIYPNVEMLPAAARLSAPSMEAALQFARRFLCVQPGTEKDARLLEAASKLIEETPQGVTVRGHRTRPQAVVWWRAQRG